MAAAIRSTTASTTASTGMGFCNLSTAGERRHGGRIGPSEPVAVSAALALEADWAVGLDLFSLTPVQGRSTWASQKGGVSTGEFPAYQCWREAFGPN